jgi:hypothetical protein
MNPIETIELKPMELYNQKMHDGAELKMELHDKYFRCIGVFNADEPKDKDDHSLGWRTVYNNFEIIVDKKAHVAMEKSWNDRDKHYCLYISVLGMSDDVKLFFKREKEIDEVKEKLTNYFYSHD